MHCMSSLSCMSPPLDKSCLTTRYKLKNTFHGPHTWGTPKRSINWVNAKNSVLLGVPSIRVVLLLGIQKQQRRAMPRPSSPSAGGILPVTRECLNKVTQRLTYGRAEPQIKALRKLNTPSVIMLRWE